MVKLQHTQLKVTVAYYEQKHLIVLSPKYWPYVNFMADTSTFNDIYMQKGIPLEKLV